jgi:hypothetical protein
VDETAAQVGQQKFLAGRYIQQIDLLFDVELEGNLSCL